MNRGVTRYIALAIAIMALYASCVMAQAVVTPEGPDSLNITNSSRAPGENASATTVTAQAGNVTSIVINNERITEAWAGYYGNITGNIILDDSDGNRFYNWELLNPTGEIYAVNSSNAPDWLSVYCLNVSENSGHGTDQPNTDISFTDGGYSRPQGDATSINNSEMEQEYGINATDLDGVNETFFQVFTGDFYTASVHFNISDGCSKASPHVSSTASTAWDEVILSDNDTLIFTALLREDAADFKGTTSDFQMLVLEDGHTAQGLVSTTWYFYVELS